MTKLSSSVSLGLGSHQRAPIFKPARKACKAELNVSVAMMLRQSVLIPVLLAALVALQGAAGQPTEADRIKACGKLKQDACRIVNACTFCRSKWGESMCFSANQIENLPAGKI